MTCQNLISVEEANRYGAAFGRLRQAERSVACFTLRHPSSCRTCKLVTLTSNARFVPFHCILLPRALLSGSQYFISRITAFRPRTLVGCRLSSGLSRDKDSRAAGLDDVCPHRTVRSRGLTSCQRLKLSKLLLIRETVIFTSPNRVGKGSHPPPFAVSTSTCEKSDNRCQATKDMVRVFELVWVSRVFYVDLSASVGSVGKYRSVRLRVSRAFTFSHLPSLLLFSF